MENNANIQAIEHTDVRGNKLLYLKITSFDQTILINIGKKTFDSIKELKTEKEMKEFNQLKTDTLKPKKEDKK